MTTLYTPVNLISDLIFCLLLVEIKLDRSERVKRHVKYYKAREGDCKWNPSELTGGEKRVLCHVLPVSVDSVLLLRVSLTDLISIPLIAFQNSDFNSLNLCLHVSLSLSSFGSQKKKLRKKSVDPVCTARLDRYLCRLFYSLLVHFTASFFITLSN